ncbi:MAG: hypothetical protein II942_04640 [Alphaproteobacteria bacterium]|nr:hypothetical protein [Alphaproteobacteria bacterium]
MKKLYLATLALGMIALPAFAETTMGEVVGVEGDLIMVQTTTGPKLTFKTNDNTTYRKKTLKRHGKRKRGMHSPNDWVYEPVAEEDDWVEITYNPETGNGSVYEVDTITVYDD